jgi:hypothetical protein
MDQAVGFIDASGLSQEEKDTRGGSLLADQSVAADINQVHDDRTLRTSIQQKQILEGKQCC